MTLSQVFNIQCRKSVQSGTKEVLEEAAAVVVVEVSGVTETEALTIIIRIPAVQVQQLPLQGRDIRVLNTRICQPGTGPDAVCISVLAVLRTSVRNRQPALGKMFSLKDHRNNDGLTSSALLTLQLIIS